MVILLIFGFTIKNIFKKKYFLENFLMKKTFKSFYELSIINLNISNTIYLMVIEIFCGL